MQIKLKGRFVVSKVFRVGVVKAALCRDMPRGWKRAGWKKEFLDELSEAAKDIGEISEEEIQRTVRNYRQERRMPEINIAAEV